MSSPQAEIWERYAAKYTPRRAVNAVGATTWLNWTQYPDHGPDETVLGDLRGKRVLELGSGAGANRAHLATLGAVCTGIDIAPSRAHLAQQSWGHVGNPGVHHRRRARIPHRHEHHFGLVHYYRLQG